MQTLEFHLLDKLIDTALAEDIGTGDITTRCTVPDGRRIHGRYIAKEAGVVCGLPVVARVFQRLDASIVFTAHAGEGEAVQKGAVIAEVTGDAASVLTGERTGLNLLQRLSGIATRTAEAVRAVQGTKARVTETRKTTPGLRALEKYAVRMGGGSNHRFNLSDGILIKDNHICAAGGIALAVEAARRNAPHTLKIEVEVESLEMLEEALQAGADIIMLDNMDLGMMAESVRRVAGRAVVEASGNMGDRDLKTVAETGVDLISIGALTHTVRALDISLRFDLIL
jgi:nicotinate-nucleotide pyrophosphorylase (carboxylating)